MRQCNITLTIDNKLILHPLSEVRSSVVTQIKKRLVFDNPKYIENEKRGFSTWGIPDQIRGYEVDEEAMIIPRGFTRQIIDILKRYNAQFKIQDHRRIFPDTEFTFLGSLKDFQITAVKVVLSRSFGTLQAPTGSGKTVIALAVIAHRKQPALVLVHTKELLNQWVERIQQFLGIAKKEIGIIGSGKRVIGQGVTVGIVNSVYPIASEIKEHIGFLIVDECHRCPSRMSTEAVSAFDSKFMLGLSATPWRNDRLTRLIYWHLGDRVHEIERNTLMDSGDVLRAEVITRETDFVSSWDASEHYSQMLSELTEDPERNFLIVDDVIREAKNGGGVCLVLSDRKVHCETLSGMLSGNGMSVELLTGDLSDNDRRGVVERLKTGLVKILVATGQLIGEGFDAPALSTLFLATPIKFDGRLLQYLGRVLRPALGKEEARVYDYVDSNIGVLAHAARARQRVYARTQRGPI